MIPTATTSTGMRQTQNLTAPPTQNTAQVLEFGCLYTHDLRRKQKRWQDGFLRFHTFNKRIMVYEAPSRNYIGDQHWREDGVLQDGDELELDRPVLVQVGEAIGTTETDLTELLEKRKKPIEVSPRTTKNSPRRDVTGVDTSTAPMRSLTGQPTQLRPKTLNALLGTPRGAMGRASVPTKSPHEPLQEDEIAGLNSERPAKRPRIEACCARPPTIAARPVGRTPASVEAPSIRDSQKTITAQAGHHRDKERSVSPISESTTKANSVPMQNPPRRKRLSEQLAVKSVNELSPKKHRTKAASNGPLESSNTKTWSEKAKPRHEIGQVPARRRPHDAGSTINDNTSASAAQSGQIKSAVEPIQIFSDEEAVTVDEPPKERVKLQMTSRKPRKKLMYRDLLPQGQPSNQPSSSDKIDTNRNGRERKLSRRPSKRAGTTLADFHEEEQGRLADRLNRYNGGIANNGNDVIEGISEKEPKAPSLFISDDDCDPLPNSHHRTKQKYSEPHQPNRPRQQQKSPQCRIDQMNTFPKVPSTVRDTALTLAKMDEIMFPSSRRHHPPKSPSPITIDESNPNNDIPPSSLPKAPPAKPTQPAAPTKLGPTTLVPSSPGFQTQSHTSPRKSSSRGSSPLKAPPSKTLSPKPLPPIEPQPPGNPLSKAPSPHKPSPNGPPPTSPPCNTSLTKPPSPNPSPTEPLPTKPPTPPPPPTNPQLHPPPLFPRLTEPLEDTFNLSIAQKPLPAFQAPRQRPRSPLKKSTSDTTGTNTTTAMTSLRPPPEVNENVTRESVVGAAEAGAGVPWSKEAWDLFGCGRDGVECTYEEFKRKEGLV